MSTSPKTPKKKQKLTDVVISIHFYTKNVVEISAKMARWRIFDLDFPKLWNKAQIISEC